MQGFDRWVASLQSIVSSWAEAALQLLPRLLGAIVLLAAGWLIATLLRSALLRLGNALIVRVARRAGGESVRHDPIVQALLKLLATVLFWVVVFVFVLAAVNVVELDEISEWLDRAAGFAPSLVIGLLVIVVGYLLSVMTRDVVRDALAPAGGAGHGQMLSRIAQGTIFVTAVIIGVGQVGISISFLTTVLSIAVAAVLGSFALAFGLGARTLVSDLIATRSIRQAFEPGQIVRVGSFEGRLLEIGTRAVLIDAPQGRVVIPASDFVGSVVVIPTPSDTDTADQ